VSNLEDNVFSSEELSMRDMIVIESLVVPSNCSVNIQLISERGPFRADRILLPAEVEGHFVLTDFKVGKNSQFVSPAAIPASFFVEEVEGDDRFLATDILPRGGIMTLSVTNVSGEPRSFAGKIVGELVPQSFDEKPLTTNNRLVVMGLGITDLSTMTASIVMQVRVPVLVDRLTLEREVAGNVVVKDLRIAGLSVYPPGGFRGDRFLFEPTLARVGDWIVVSVERRTPLPEAILSATPPATPPVPKIGFWTRFWATLRGFSLEEKSLPDTETETEALAEVVGSPKHTFVRFSGTLSGTLHVGPYPTE